MASEHRLSNKVSSEAPPPGAQELIKTIGKASGKGLSMAQAKDLYSRILDGSFTSMQVGAALMALRVRGESLPEMLGAMAAAEPHIRELRLSSGPTVVVIPSYNGARLLPNLLPLLACLLSDEGIPVLVHGLRSDRHRVTSAEVFHALGMDAIGGPVVIHEKTAADLSPGQSIDLSAEIMNRFKRGDPAFVPLDVLSPALAWLLDCRKEMGVRNTGHSLVKLLQPVSACPVLQLASYTHSEFRILQQEVFASLGAPALQSRGCEGEVVASTKRITSIEWIHAGRVETLLEPESLAPSDVPALPAAQDVAATAAWTQSVLSGAIPVPRAIALQIACIKKALGLDPIGDGQNALTSPPSLKPLEV
jgi:anthranilate phosphoribosyltransferase